MSDLLFDKESLIRVYSRRTEHQRYQKVIDKFYKDLKNNLEETKLNIEELFETKKEVQTDYVEKPFFNLVISEIYDLESENELEIKETYHYELGKLATKRNSWEFDFFGNILKSKCSKNKLVVEELEHMKANISNDLEYYSSFHLIRSVLKED